MNHFESFLRKNPKMAAVGTGLSLVLFTFLILLERLHTQGEPWFCDIICYASMGKEMLFGRRLYSDLWDDRPPATYLTFEAAEKIFGQGPQLIIWIGFLTSVAIMLGLYAAGKGLSGKTSGGLWAAGLFTLLSTEVFLEADQPNTEIFMNACMVWAFALLVWRWKKNTPWWAYVLAGILWGWNALYKHYMPVEGIFLGLAYVLSASKWGERAKAAWGMALAWGAAFVVGAGTIAYFILTDRGKILYDTLVTYGHYYSGNLLANLLIALEPGLLFPPWFWFALPMALLALSVPFLAQKKQQRWAWIYLAFLLLKVVEKAMPGRLYRHHYYQLWLPALCLGAGWAVVLLYERFQKKAVVIPWAAGFTVLLFILIHQGHWFGLPAREWTWANYGRDYDDESQVLREVSLVLKPDEDFYEWAEFPRFYFASGRRVPVGVIFAAQNLKDWTTYSGGPLWEVLTQRTVNDLQTNNPEMVIWDKHWPPKGFETHPVNAYILSHYRPFAAFGPDGRYEFWCRIGGRLAQKFNLS